MVFGLMVFFFSIIHEKPSYAQYMTGVTASSYSGVNSNIVNPAFMSNSRYFLDINIAGAGSFFHNNFAYMAREEYNFFRFLDPNYAYPMHDKEYGTGERPAYTVENKKRKQAFFSNRILGPSVMLAYNDHTFAMNTAFRSVSGFRNIPYDMANYLYYSLDYSPQHGKEYEHRDPMRTASLSWSELGFSWAWIYAKYDRAHWSLGITAKMLFGHAAYYVYLDHLKYFVPDDENLYVRNVHGEAAYSFPIDYDNNELYNGSIIKGTGMGFDFGLSYTHTVRGHSRKKYSILCQQPFHEYKYRIGVSLLDFGWINFNDVSRKYELDDYHGIWYRLDTLEAYYNNINYISEDINRHLCGSDYCALTANNFNILLPMSIGAQFDYNYFKNWFVSGWIRFPLIYSKNQVSATSGLMVVPRMETAEFEFGVPFTLHEMKSPMLGAYIRIYNLTIGTDNAAGFLNITDHYGYDFYVAIKFNLLKGNCWRRMSSFCPTGAYDFRKATKL